MFALDLVIIFVTYSINCSL